MRTDKPAGYVLYDGPSLIDGAPIVAIATMRSDNRKTGNMVQTWILRADQSPVDASKALADSSICGDCKHRQSLGGACYVNIGQGPNAVYRAYRAGKYEDRSGINAMGADARRAIGRGRKVRLGAYGDPAAVPSIIWGELLTGADGHTGYTHQWRTLKAQSLRELCMASVDNDVEYTEARAMGWRTFRVATVMGILHKREFECASTARGTQCIDCMACDGAGERGPTKASVAIVVHGSLAKRFTQARQ